MAGAKVHASASELSRSQYEHLIDEWIFSERDRAILKRRLLDGITFDRLAEEFDLSPRHVNGRNLEEFFAVMDELMSTLRIVNPPLYGGVMRKFQ